MIKNKKLIINLLIYNVIGVALFLTTLLLDVFRGIDIYNISLNCIIFIVSSIISLVYYANNYYLIRNEAYSEDCVIMSVITAIFISPQLIFALRYPGVHFSIAITWGFGSIALVVFNIITYLRSIDNIEISKRKYTAVITGLKTWAIMCYIGVFVLSFSNLFHPDDMVFF